MKRPLSLLCLSLLFLFISVLSSFSVFGESHFKTNLINFESDVLEEKSLRLDLSSNLSIKSNPSFNSTLEIILNNNKTFLKSDNTLLNIPNTLKDSVVFGNWEPDDGLYNCYTFAIDKKYGIKNPGQYSGKNTYENTPIYDIALLTMEDLNNLGYNCVKITSINPNTIKNGEKVICVRKGDTDYHFMKLSNGNWYHKPGLSAVLQYIREVNISNVWTDEKYDTGRFFPPFNYYYSDIYYIIYDDYHNYINKITGNNYHSGDKHYYQYADICSLCGNYGASQWMSFPCPGTGCVTPWNFEK